MAFTLAGALNMELAPSQPESLPSWHKFTSCSFSNDLPVSMDAMSQTLNEFLSNMEPWRDTFY